MNKLFSKRLRELAFFSLRGCVNWHSFPGYSPRPLEGQILTSSFREVPVAPNKLLYYFLFDKIKGNKRIVFSQDKLINDKLFYYYFKTN